MCIRDRTSTFDNFPFFLHTHILTLFTFLTTPVLFLELVNYLWNHFTSNRNSYSTIVSARVIRRVPPSCFIHFHFVTTNTVLILRFLHVPFMSLTLSLCYIIMITFSQVSVDLHYYIRFGLQKSEATLIACD